MGHFTPVNNLLGCEPSMPLYWLLSYTRWQDERFYPQCKVALLDAISTLHADEMGAFRDYNMKKHYAQGIGRYSVGEVYDQGVDNIRALCFQLCDKEFMFGDKFHVIDACCYGFLANIYYFPMQTPLKEYCLSQPLLASYV